MLFMLFIRTYIEKPSINWTNSPRVSSICRLMPMQRSKSSLVLKPPAAKGWCQIMPNLYEKTLTGITNGSKTLYYFGPGGQNTNNSSQQQTKHDWLSRASGSFLVTCCFIHLHSICHHTTKTQNSSVCTTKSQKRLRPLSWGTSSRLERGCQTINLLRRGHPAMNKLHYMHVPEIGSYKVC